MRYKRQEAGCRMQEFLNPKSEFRNGRSRLLTAIDNIQWCASAMVANWSWLVPEAIGFTQRKEYYGKR
ncbi:MAG TPA: hypothetical protein VJ440_11315 [Candidatus Brocadiaceae bacterium]|nr:hypothetical protein [Candidatus Brocadiaceae bacterium]